MKQAKILTDGLAILIAIFILIFLATEFIGYHPGENALKDSSKLELFFEQNDSYRTYCRLVTLLFISAACGIFFGKLPELGAFSSLFTLCYLFFLYSEKMLTKHPMVLLSFGIAHFFGNVIICGYVDRKGSRRHSSNAALLSSLTALGFTGYTLFFQERLRSVSDFLAAFKEAEITVNPKVLFFPDLIRIAGLRLQNEGAEEARDMISKFARESELTTLQCKVLDNIEEEQFGAYLRLAILLFGAAVLIFALRRYLRLTPVVLSALPAIYVAIKIHSEALSSFALPLLAATVAGLIFSVVDFDQYGKGHDPVYDAEPAEEFPSDGPDETYYT